MYQHLLLLTAALLHLNVPPCEAVDFYVRPTQPTNQTCPERCHTLDQYAQNVSLFEGQTNVTLLFLGGVHNLTYNFITSGQTKFVMSGLDSNISAVIDLTLDIEINFSNMVVFELYNITIKGTLRDNPFGQSGQTFNIIAVQNFSQYHVEIINMYVLINSDSTVITKSNYTNSTLEVDSGSIKIQESNLTSNFHNGGIPGFSYTCENYAPTESIVEIQESTMVNWVTAISIDCPQGRLIITNTNFIQNNLVVEIDSHIDTLTIQDTHFIFSSMAVVLKSVNVTNFTIRDTRFDGSYTALSATNTTLHNMLVKDSVFENNANSVVTLQSRSTNQAHQTISFQNCTLVSNIATGITLLNIHGNITLKNCHFHDNRDTSIIAYQSDFELGGETSFTNNIADRGGAISLFYSRVKFSNNSNITFQNNSAEEFGGAIYVESVTSLFHETLRAAETLYVDAGNFLKVPICFYQQESATTTQVSFIQNYAPFGGTDIYGASSYADDCIISGNSTFNFTNSASNFSSVTSDPTRVCFCPDVDNSTQLCNTLLLIYQGTHFPGEKFTIPLVVAGYNFNTVAGAVYANVIGDENTAHFSEGQHIQTADFSQCNNLEYTIFSKEPFLRISLTTYEIFSKGPSVTDIYHNTGFIDNHCYDTGNTPCIALLTTPIYMEIILEQCPLGFVLDENHGCGCDNNLNRLHSFTNVACEIKNRIGYIYREGTIWVGIDESETGLYLTNKHCPHNYCKSDRIPVDLMNKTSLDEQCVSNRAGVLCGKCANGSSLQLGGNQCIKCPNNNTLALLIFFAAAGFLLVFFIKVLDLTVANGTINGLIFYANVIWRCNDILFSLNDRQNIGYWILTVPIAWINLDFGIESCFYDGLDQSGKSLLQFVFPVYIWSIAGLIILVSHYSTRATKLFGNNSVSVLSTLFLLSYGKVFRNITDAFTYAELADSTNSTLTVWSFDGNVLYGQSAHIAPIIVALLFLLLFCFPFTLTILLVPCLKSKSNLKSLRWINTLKPFFDTYYGPLKHKVKYQCWTGTLLLVRVVLLSVFAATSTRSPNANILLLVLTALLLLMYSAMVGLLYKKWYVSLLENMYILNLIFLGSSFLFYEAQDNDNYVNPVPFMSIGLALFQFACVIIFHLVQQFKKCFVRKPKENVTIQEYPEHRPLQDCAKNNVKNYNTHFRESLFEYTEK